MVGQDPGCAVEPALALFDNFTQPSSCFPQHSAHIPSVSGRPLEHQGKVNFCCVAAQRHQSRVHPRSLDIHWHLSLCTSLIFRTFPTSKIFPPIMIFFHLLSSYSVVSSRPWIIFGNVSFLPLHNSKSPVFPVSLVYCRAQFIICLIGSSVSVLFINGRFRMCHFSLAVIKTCSQPFWDAASK